jgi:hypothetical protein
MATHDRDFADAAGARHVPLTDGRMDDGQIGAGGPAGDLSADDPAAGAAPRQ